MTETTVIEINADTTLPANFQAVFDLWTGLPKSPDLPLASGFSLEFVPPKLLPWSVLVDVETDPLDFRFRFWGTERSNLIGAEMTGKLVSDIAQESMREGNREEYANVYRHGKAVLCRTPIVMRSGLESSRLSIRLPLSNDGTEVSRIFSAIDPDTINEEHYEYYGTTPKRGYSS
jgi:hypothetical protein